MISRKFKDLILILSIVLLSVTGIYPKVTSSPPPIPDQFIADIFPKNNNTDIQLLNASSIITLNATDLIKEIGVTYNGTYTLFNPKNITNLTISLPFSLCLNVINTTFGVFVNDTQVPFEIVSITDENLITMGVDINIIPSLAVHCPITLITSNLTLMDNNTYVVKYQFKNTIPKPLSFRNLFFLVHSSDTVKLWNGNATERVELNVVGGNPIFSRTGHFEDLPEILDIEGGKRYTFEWSDSQNSTIQIGIRFYGSSLEISPEKIVLFVLNSLALGAITSVIVLWIIRCKKKRF
jgi:hypothetical protein